ncbi:MAG: MAPEG family protein [Paracoccaceae bacterium]
MFLAQRRFGNLAEYAAMALLILLLLNCVWLPAWLHGYGATLVVLRLIHPLALFDRAGAPVWQKAGRFVSAAGTALLLLAGGIALILA